MQDVKMVIGGNFGDEGKGLMTDYFAAEAVKSGRETLVICSNGGAQRGHTVTTPSGIRHVFHHFGSGTLAGADTWLPRYFIVNPMIFMDEYEELLENGVVFEVPGPEQKIKLSEGVRKGRKVFMDPECPVTTPYDMITNQIIEEHRGAGRHGSCGVGIWETLLRDGLSLGEMADLSDEQLQNYLRTDCREQMYGRFDRLGICEIPERWKDILEDEGLIRSYIYDFREMCSMVRMKGVDVLREYDRLIFEAGQGLLLDRCRKDYGCHTTPSNTGLRNPAELLREYLHMPDAESVGRHINKDTGDNEYLYMPDTGNTCRKVEILRRLYGQWEPASPMMDVEVYDQRKPAYPMVEVEMYDQQEPTYPMVDAEMYDQRKPACPMVDVEVYDQREPACRMMDVEVCYVTRTYLTRHGAGPFPEECGKDEINPDMRDLTNVPNPHQGTLRYGRLEENAFIRRIREDFDSERLAGRVKMRMTAAVTHVNEYAGEIAKMADYISDGETRECVRCSRTRRSRCA